MLELTVEQCKELEDRVLKKLAERYPPETAGLAAAVCNIAVPAVICTIREYERMTQEK
ncbi:MAG: hypothetical protein HDT16_02070 [Oscillibacter sp.]|nr:hypothetical protein [Oscillibacter sp.]